jgi:copper transport protein
MATRAAVFLHILGLSVWIGALVPLAMLLWQRGTGAKAALLGFSQAAPYAVVSVVASGIGLATIQVGSVAALWSSDYGKLLLCKLALLVALAGLVAWNRFWLTPRVAAGDQHACGLMARSIAGELVVVLAILAVVAGWRFTPPPRALAAAAALPLRVHVHTDRAMADVELAPGRVGLVRASVRPLTADFAPISAKEVTIVLSNPSAGIEPIRRRAIEEEAGVWRSEVAIPVAGRWLLRLEILINDFERVTLEADAPIRPN